MVHYQRAQYIIFLFILTLLISACGGGNADFAGDEIARQPTKAPEVVVFATQAATPTQAPPTNTPLPTPVPATPTPIPAEPTATPTPGLARAEKENPLTGLIVDPEVFQRRPLHVRLGNDLGALPHINISQADIVYEEIVEWWITRLTAVYYTNAPEMVAPIRSARIINTQLTQQYDAALINSGGSDPIRWQLSQLPIVDLDEYFHPNPYFSREGETWQKRLAFNAREAHRYMESEGLQSAVKMRGFAFDETSPSGEPGETIYIDYPSKDSKVFWEYDQELKAYKRSMAGEATTDGATGEVVSAANIIIYFAEHYETDIVEDSTGATSVGININGEGTAWVFRNGLLIKGRWRTDGFETPEFTFENGEAIPLHPGQTWIEVVPTEYEILVNEE